MSHGNNEMSYPEMAKAGLYKFIVDNGRCLEVFLKNGDGFTHMSVVTSRCFKCGGERTTEWHSCATCPEPKGVDGEHGACICCGAKLDYFYNCPICSLPAKQELYNKCYPTGGK